MLDLLCPNFFNDTTVVLKIPNKKVKLKCHFSNVVINKMFIVEMS